MARKLERISAQLGGLFEQPTAIQTSPRPALCPVCHGWGYTNCPQARIPGGDKIAIAFRQGVACQCSYGAEFAQNQMAWMDSDSGAIHNLTTEEIQ